LAEQLVELLYQSWADLDQAISGLTPEEAGSRYEGCNRIAWCVGHVTQQVDSWINRNFQGLPPHPIASQPIFQTGASGDAPEWSVVLDAMRDVRGSARSFLDAVDADSLKHTVPYRGSITYLRPIGLSLGYALMRISAHNFMHTGEISTIRSLLHHPSDDSWMWGEAFLPFRG
jgi:hypothetical protein